MATTWKNNLINFDLSYWIIRDVEDGMAESLNGLIQFDMACRPLEIDETSEFNETVDVLRKRCARLLTNLCRKHGLSQTEILEIVGHAIVDNCVNIDTIETDDERDKRVKDQERKNKDFFDKYSEEL